MIREWVEDLLTLTDKSWCQYAFNRDPLVGRITPAGQMEYAQNAMNCGETLARDLRRDYGDIPLENLVRQLGLNLHYKSGESSIGYTLFATYEEPDLISIFSDNADATDALIDEQGLRELIGRAKTADLLIAHEIYHYLEYSRPDIYTTKKFISLWKIGPIENRSRIPCLEEIGAMAFAKELVGLKCSAYLFNVLMLYPKNPQRARETYEQYMRFAVERAA